MPSVKMAQRIVPAAVVAARENQTPCASREGAGSEEGGSSDVWQSERLAGGWPHWG